MRIRSILPDFYRSEDVGAMDWHTRLVFIGLWSYVDDNGVGRDAERLIASDLFPFDVDPRETLRRVSTALDWLSEHGQIQRYRVGGKPYLFVKQWDRYQRVHNPNKERYPRPTCDNIEPPETLRRPSVEPPEVLATGEGEKGRRGEGSNPSSAHADAFDEFWFHCPRKVGKDAARKAWKNALRRAGGPGPIIAGLRAHLPAWETYETQYVPHPSTWLNEGRWQDEPPQPRLTPSAQRLANNLSLVQRLELEEAETHRRAIGE